MIPTVIMLIIIEKVKKKLSFCNVIFCRDMMDCLVLEVLQETKVQL